MRRSVGLLPENRFCRGVLLLPSDHREYLRGRRRQAVRTNVRRAVTAGVVCEVVGDPAPALLAVREVVENRRVPLSEDGQRIVSTSWTALFARPEVTLMVARDQRGRHLAVMAVVIDELACLIKVAVASDHDARWALHDRLVRILIDRGVRYLLVEGGGPFGALGLEYPEQYYQQLLGYQLRHMVPATPHRAKRGRRRFALVVIAAMTVAALTSPGASARRSGISSLCARSRAARCAPPAVTALPETTRFALVERTPVRALSVRRPAGVG